MIFESISFFPLQESDFPLMLQWLSEPHVKIWWDKDITYTLDLVEKKYESYIDHSKPQAFIIYQKHHPIGYIQYYDAHDEKKEFDLPESLAGIDIFIGDKNYIGKGMGSFCMKKFLNDIVYKNYKYACVDPEYKNLAAVRAYKKAGFKIIKRVNNILYMVARKKQFRLSVEDSIALEISFKKTFDINDHLWIFGSRANLTKKGGDIDLYIETYKNAKDAVKANYKFSSMLQEKMGEQKIDVVLNLRNSDTDLPIYTVAKDEGIQIL